MLPQMINIPSIINKIALTFLKQYIRIIYRLQMSHPPEVALEQHSSLNVESFSRN